MSVDAKGIVRWGGAALLACCLMGGTGSLGLWASAAREVHLLSPGEPVEVQVQTTFVWQGEAPPEDCALRFEGERVEAEPTRVPLRTGDFDGIRYASVVGSGVATLDAACFASGAAWATHPEAFEGLCLILLLVGFSGAGVAFKVAFFGALFGAKRSPGLDAPGMAADTHRRT